MPFILLIKTKSSIFKSMDAIKKSFRRILLGVVKSDNVDVSHL